jgi:hypothetical protein
LFREQETSLRISRWLIAVVPEWRYIHIRCRQLVRTAGDGIADHLMGVLEASDLMKVEEGVPSVPEAGLKL